MGSDKQRLFIIRLDRSAKNQEVHVIDKTAFDGIKSDPLIEFSSLLEALFFRTAIVCENEADCLFYRNIYRTVDGPAPSEDAFWVSAHGKQNIKNLVTPLRKFGVRVISLPDLDIINDDITLRTLIESHGGDWNDFKSDFKTIAKLMGERNPTFAKNDVVQKIKNVIENIEKREDGLFPPKSAENIKKILKNTSPWQQLKDSGMTAFGKGNTRMAAVNLIDRMSNLGILVPDVGDMESFYSISGKHGIEWVNNVLRLDIKTNSDLSKARDFAKRIHEVQCQA